MDPEVLAEPLAKKAIIRKAARWLGWFHRHSDVATEPFAAAAYTVSAAGKIKWSHAKRGHR